MKIWECSLDLVNYLSKSPSNLREKKVLELGCGAALRRLQVYPRRQGSRHEQAQGIGNSR